MLPPMRMARGAIWLAAVVGVPGCYDQPRPNCTYACGPSNACPPMYMCGSDDVCHLVLDNGELAVCQFPTIDGGPADASIDAEPPQFDSEPPPPDALVDAEPPPDALVDAVPPFDATPVPDAEPAEVEVVDCLTVTPDATITTSAGAYIPVNTTIILGQVIRFDPSGFAHDMDAGTPAAPLPDLFDTPVGQVVCLRFNDSGNYPFFCSVHDFTGSVLVSPPD